MTARSDGLPRNHPGRPKSAIRAKNRIMRSVIEAVDRSGFTDSYIAARAGIGKNELSNWRAGYRGNPSVLRLSWVLEAIGAEIEIIDRNERKKT